METPRSARSSRSKSLFPHLLSSPKSVASLDISGCSPKSSKSRKILPAKFIQEMPKRSFESIQDEENKITSVSPIKKASFYGGGYVPKYCVAAEKSANSSSSDLENSFDSKMSIKTPPSKTKNKVKSAPGSLIKRRSIGNDFNKGVKHAIKKPKPQKAKKVSPEKPVKEPVTPKTPKIKHSTIIQSIQNSSHSTGKIAMTKHTKVNYEIKNGMPVFSLRRSPRKLPHGSPKIRERNPNEPKTPKQLFTPSSKGDFLNDFAPSPPRSRGKHLPSPVKFHVEDDRDENVGGSLCNIIDSLGNSQADEESAQIAAETVQQLEDIGTFIPMDYAEKSQDDLAFYVSNEEAIHIAEKSVAAQKAPMEFNLQEEIEKSLSAIQPPTDTERNENRCSSLKLQLEDEDNDSTKKSSPKKNFAIFDKGARKPLEPIQNTLTKKSTHETKKTIATKEDENQMTIDAGQKMGPTTCHTCGAVYHPGNVEDEKIHKIKHDAAIGIISFKGWKNENNVGDFHDGRIIVVKSTDPKKHWEKVDSVLEVVDRHLGFSSANTLRNKENSKIYLFIDANRIVGFLVAEFLHENDVVSRASPKDKLRQDWTLDDIPNPRVPVGISRLWVAQDYRRKSIATRLVRAMENSFQPGRILKKGQQYAFSHTTPDGTKFASKYVGLQSGCFLTYKQCDL